MYQVLSDLRYTRSMCEMQSWCWPLISRTNSSVLEFHMRTVQSYVGQGVITTRQSQEQKSTHPRRGEQVRGARQHDGRHDLGGVTVNDLDHLERLRVPSGDFHVSRRCEQASVAQVANGAHLALVHFVLLQLLVRLQRESVCEAEITCHITSCSSLPQCHTLAEPWACQSRGACHAREGPSRRSKCQTKPSAPCSVGERP